MNSMIKLQNFKLNNKLIKSDTKKSRKNYSMTFKKKIKKFQKLIEDLEGWHKLNLE